MPSRPNGALSSCDVTEAAVPVGATAKDDSKGDRDEDNLEKEDDGDDDDDDDEDDDGNEDDEE